MLPKKVPSSMIPLAQESLRSGTSSGSNPYFDGPNKADCELMRNTAAHSSGKLCSQRPRMVTAITKISINFVPITTLRLL